MGHGPVALLVGEIGGGKTTICRRVAQAARRRGLHVAGILTRPRCDTRGRRVGLVAVDLWGGRSRRLASLTRRLSDLGCGPYSFDPAAFAWAIGAVQAALAQAPDLAIIDEIGPLELGGAGFAPILEPVLAARCPVVLVVRRACCAALEARLPVQPLVFEVLAATRDGLPEAILAALGVQCRSVTGEPGVARVPQLAR